MEQILEKEKSAEEQLSDALNYLNWGIDYWKKAFALLPKQVRDTIDNSAEYGYKTLAKRITESLNDVKRFEEAIQNERQAILDNLDKTWSEIAKKHDEINNKIKKLNESKFNVDTYRAEQILKVLEQIERFSPEQWKNFELICHKLSE
jgi:tetratricopeptide (TPR) repeat protein